MSTHNPDVLPDNLPVPEDDGAAAHLQGLRLPHIALSATTGATIDLAAVSGIAIVFAYPRTGVPGVDPLVPDWDEIPGARGCTPHTRGYRDHYAEFVKLGASVFGLSTQDTPYQQEFAERMHVQFPILSDEKLALSRAIFLPAMDIAGHTLIKRLAWIARDGVIERIFYPVFPPDKNAETVLAALHEYLAP